MLEAGYKANVIPSRAEATIDGRFLPGQEDAFPDAHVHARAFEIARDAGLGITIHAGEWGGAAQVRARHF